MSTRCDDLIRSVAVEFIPQKLRCGTDHDGSGSQVANYHCVRSDFAIITYPDRPKHLGTWPQFHPVADDWNSLVSSATTNYNSGRDDAILAKHCVLVQYDARSSIGKLGTSTNVA